MTGQLDRATVQSLRAAVGSLATIAASRMDERLSWYRAMDPADRSWIGLVAQAGIAAFVAWLTEPHEQHQITADVFGTAPRELTRAVSLRQTLELLRVVVDVVEEQAPQLTTGNSQASLREAVLRYSREVAFSAAEIYARAAENRGAWDARLEALVVDALVRGESDDALRSRAAALGWTESDRAVVVAGSSERGQAPVEDLVDQLRRLARNQGADALIGVQGQRVIAVLGRAEQPMAACAALAAGFGPGPVVVGPEVANLTEAGRSARAALAGLVAVRGWPQAPRPVLADDLLPERMLSGDSTARRALIDRAYHRLEQAGHHLLETTATYLELGRNLEGTARILYIHANTVRYRLRRVSELTGWDPTDPREGFILQVAISAGRLAGGGSNRGSD